MSSFWTKERDDQLGYMVECRMSAHQIARVLRSNATSVARRIETLGIKGQTNYRSAPWPPTKDYWAVCVQFDDVSPEVLAAEKKRNPGTIFAKKPSYTDGHTMHGGSFALFVR